ncbi:GOLPH3/VPS74 family protein [Plantibacter sp. YIM 135347]|uniref:GOLPH3/VPS74 family protein n=1 Tax=Plantibacter sp. YIM 135347 TaxID=3423919 RepID=UPI003D339DBE
MTRRTPQLATATTEATMPEAVMLLLFDPRTGTIAGEGLPLMYTLGGAMLTELALGGHLDVDDRHRSARAVGDGPADPLLRAAWHRLPNTPSGIRSLVVDIGTRSREGTLDRLVARGDIRRVPRRFLWLFPSHALEDGDTGTRDRLLAPVRAALLNDATPDGRSAALIALLSASNSLPALHADIPWSGEVYTRGKEIERGDWGAKAASELIVASLVAQIVGTAFATTVATLARPN